MAGNVADTNYSMTKAQIHRIFLQFRALSWVARELKVNKSTLSRFLRGERPASDVVDLKAKAEMFARKLEATRGAAKDDVNGKSVSSQIKKLQSGGAK